MAPIYVDQQSSKAAAWSCRRELTPLSSGVVTGQAFRYLPDHSGYLNDYRFKMGGASLPRWLIESYLTSTVPGYSDHTIEIAMQLDFNFTFRMNQKRSLV